MMQHVACPSCGERFASLTQHFANNPSHNPVPPEVAPPPRAPPSSAGQGASHHFEKRFERKVVMDYANLRYKCFVDTSHCGQFHACAIGWFDVVIEEALDAMSAASSLPEALRHFSAIASVAKDVMKKYTSQKMRDHYLINTVKVPYIEPSDYSPLPEFRKHAAKMSLAQVLGRILQNDKAARDAIIAKSEEWKSGIHHRVRATQFADITHGWICRSHPHLMRTATPDEIKRRVVRIGAGVHNDDVTVVNAIGTKKGDHKDSITSGDILNLPQHMRKMHEYKLLLSVVNSKFLKERGGMEWSICGVDENGKETVTDSLAAEFRKCSFDMELPDETSPTGFSVFPIEIYFIVAYTDWLANAALGYTAESTSADYPCCECMWESKAAQKRAFGGTKKRSLTGQGDYKLRSHKDMQAHAERLKQRGGKLSKIELQMQLKAMGMTKLTCVLDDKLIPGADSVLSKPPDVMHLYGAGLTRIEGCQMTEIIFKDKKLVAVLDPWKKLNENLVKLNASLPRGKRLPKLYPQRKGKKLNEQHLDLNASETLLYATHSSAIYDGVLSEAGEMHPCWVSWTAHCCVVKRCLQHVYTEADADDLENLIEQHLSLFEMVPEYLDLDRPKHHFQIHLPRALLNYGPFRGFWCFPFEAYMQLIKKIVDMGNFKMVPWQVCHFWSMRAAFLLSEKGAMDIRDDAINASSEVKFFDDTVFAKSEVIASTRSNEPRWLQAYAYRMVRSFERGSLEVRGGDWVVFNVDGASAVGKVGEMVEFIATGGSFVRAMMLDVRPVSTFNELRGEVIAVPMDLPTQTGIVCVESTSFHEVHAAESEGHLELTYVY